MSMSARFVKYTHEQSGDVVYAIAWVHYDHTGKIVAVSPVAIDLSSMQDESTARRDIAYMVEEAKVALTLPTIDLDVAGFDLDERVLTTSGFDVTELLDAPLSDVMKKYSEWTDRTK
jgi:hypothetical protein